MPSSNASLFLQAVFLLDVDFVVSKEFGALVNSWEGWRELQKLLSSSNIVVVPGFEAADDKAIRDGRQAIKEAEELAAEGAAGLWLGWHCKTSCSGFCILSSAAGAARLCDATVSLPPCN